MFSNVQESGPRPLNKTLQILASSNGFGKTKLAQQTPHPIKGVQKHKTADEDYEEDFEEAS
jgi:hypothetical protein